MSETVLNRAWRSLREKFGPQAIRPLRLHDFRHTWATLALQAGRNVRWVADVLGHANPGFTLQVYAHVIESEHQDLGFLAGFHSWNLKEPRPLAPVSKEDVKSPEGNGNHGGRAPTRTGDPLLVRQVL